MPRKYSEETRASTFWAKVDRGEGPRACWPWRGYVGRGGYGHTWYRGACIDAHRLAYILTHEHVTGFYVCVCHRCDNRRCCNPTHLFLGSRDDNQKDMARKGRSAYGARLNMAVLTEKQVVAIRHEYAAGLSSRKTAKKYGTSRGNVDLIVSGVTWRRTPGPIRPRQHGIRRQKKHK